MLVPSRQMDEAVMTGDDIEVTAVDIRRNKVRLGIIAAKSIPAQRKQVYLAILRQERPPVERVPIADLSTLQPNHAEGAPEQEGG